MKSKDDDFPSIVLLLRKHRAIDLASMRRAVGSAFRDAPEPARVAPLEYKPAKATSPVPTAYGVALGPLRLCVMAVNQPYVGDAVKVADQIKAFGAQRAVREHTAWLAVDLMGQSEGIDNETAHKIIGKLIAELLQDDVLGLLRRPGGPVIGYDFSFIPLFRCGKASHVFQHGPPDRIVNVRTSGDEMAAAAAEARRRWPQFLDAFAHRRSGQRFAVKKCFEESGRVEHMWVHVTSIEGAALSGTLANEPGNIKSLKLNSPVTLAASEVEDWLYTDGREHVGGFQAKVLRREE